MSRRRQSVVEDLIEVAAMLPWWVGVMIGALSYFLLHPLAEAPPVTASGLNDLSGMVNSQFIRTAAMIGQYILPLVFIIGAVLSAIRAFKGGSLLKAAKATRGSADLMDISWREFEQLIGETFRERGFSVAETPSGPDGGVDLELRKNGELHLVQCKRWRAYKVGVEIVRELYGVMAARGAAGGYVISSGVFTNEAEKFAHGRNIELWDGAKLKAMIRHDRVESRSGLSQVASAPHANLGSREGRTTSETPRCPVCGADMVLRTTRRGANAGQQFLGCSSFPRCKGTRNRS